MFISQQCKEIADQEPVLEISALPWNQQKQFFLGTNSRSWVFLHEVQDAIQESAPIVSKAMSWPVQNPCLSQDNYTIYREVGYAEMVRQLLRTYERWHDKACLSLNLSVLFAFIFKLGSPAFRHGRLGPSSTPSFE